SLEQFQKRQHSGSASAWRSRLAGIVDYPETKQVEAFISNEVMRAMKHLSQGLTEQGWPAKAVLDSEHSRAYIEVEVHKPDQLDFMYEVRLREYELPAFATPETPNLANTSEPAAT